MDGKPAQPPAATCQVTDDGWTSTTTHIDVQDFTGSTPQGPTFAITETTEPVDIFHEFFPIALFTLIAEYTSTNLRRATLEETSTEEISAWVGIRIIMCLVKLPEVHQYWSDHPAFHNELICRTMPRDRFYDLTTHLACADPDSHQTFMRTSNTATTARLLTRCSTCRRCGTPLWTCARPNTIPADSCRLMRPMVKYKGFLVWVRKFFMPLKPIRSGFKLYAVCESPSGYLCNFMVHPSAKTPTTMKEITMKVMSPFLSKYHQVFTDKLYTSVATATQLLKQKTYMTGAVKSNSKGLPKDFKTDRQVLRLPNTTTPRGT